MKARTSLIVFFIATNLASIGYIAWQATQRNTPAPSAIKPNAVSSAKRLGGAKMEEAIVQRDATTLRDLLRNAHYSEEVVQKMVSTLIWGAYDKRRQELYRQTSEEKWWAPYDVTIAEPTAAELAELTALEKKALAEEIRLFRKLSDDRMTYEYQFLSPEKQLAVAELEADYSELFVRIDLEAGDFPTLADERKRKLLTDEQEKDIKALLSPEEQRTRELRSGVNLSLLNEAIPRGQLTEAEYIRLFDLQKSFDEKYPDPFSDKHPKNDAELALADTQRKERDEAENVLKKEVIAMLGESRVAEQKLKEDVDFRLAEGATKRFSLPTDTPKRLLEIRANVAAETQRVYADASLTGEAKTKQLEDIGAVATARVEKLLGAEAAQSIAASSSDLGWLKAAQSGRVVIYDTANGFWSSHAVGESPDDAASNSVFISNRPIE